jgi:hypothetical protein
VSFSNTAYLDDYGSANSVAVGSDGTVFLADGIEGLFAYEYSTATASAEEYSKNPVVYELIQNYPNPFNPSTTIEFTLPKSEFVELKIYNILGKEVSTLVSNKLNQVNHTFQFDGMNLASGIYFYLIETGEFQDVKKMILIK